MKKLISSVMAVAMVASMATVSFAADATTIKVDNTSKLYKDNDGTLYQTAGTLMLNPAKLFMWSF